MSANLDVILYKTLTDILRNPNTGKKKKTNNQQTPNKNIKAGLCFNRE